MASSIKPPRTLQNKYDEESLLLDSNMSRADKYIEISKKIFFKKFQKYFAIFDDIFRLYSFWQ